ncbi:hypothetical protein VM1G_05674 [Cytospora mali]|uniref:Protein HRI1 n=1 Tax=Cytospora mali TaxID=578113 RepID=A0A194W389_CYTMA|nr:hypothetical protein VM1G_05674 [Valsa mali]
MGSISIREHIRWGTDAPSEPTSTLVLTSPGRRFVDVRVLRRASSSSSSSSSSPPTSGPKHPSDENFGILPKDQIDWAFAGTSSSSKVTRHDGSQVSHSIFHHWVDSRSKEPETIRDEGDMFSQPDDMMLETGRMVNPATGIETDYEELWRDEEPKSISVGEATCVVFQLQDDSIGKRGQFVRLGQYAQGVLQIGNSFTAERWLWDQGQSKWRRLVKTGDSEAPSLETLLEKNGSLHMEGEQVETPSGTWTVIEVQG